MEGKGESVREGETEREREREREKKKGSFRGKEKRVRF